MTDRPQNITLEDDGTMDTVMSFVCPDCGESVEWRYCEGPRDEDGVLNMDLMEQIVIDDWLASDGCECNCIIGAW